MADVKWIKITTTMFEDEKIDFIESLPDADSLLVIWIKLLTLAGRCNANGFIFLTEDIPYTDEMLAHRFKRPLSVIKLALETFRRLKMIEIDSAGYLKISNWEKHQNTDGLDKIREQTRRRVAKHREAKKLKESGGVTSNVTVTQGNATDIDIDKEYIYTVFQHWNSKEIIKHRQLTDKRKSHIRAKLKNYSVAEITDAIDNYATVLNGDEYYWTHRWALEDFLLRGLDKFLTENNPFENHKKHQESSKQETARAPTAPYHQKVDIDPEILKLYQGGGDH